MSLHFPEVVLLNCFPEQVMYIFLEQNIIDWFNELIDALGNIKHYFWITNEKQFIFVNTFYWAEISWSWRIDYLFLCSENGCRKIEKRFKKGNSSPIHQPQHAILLTLTSRTDGQAGRQAASGKSFVFVLIEVKSQGHR